LPRALPSPAPLRCAGEGRWQGQGHDSHSTWYRKWGQVTQRLGKFEAILLDDIGYVQQSREEMEVLFTFLAERYERGSVLLTSNLPFSKWEAIFKDPMTTAAAIDRLVHHSVILELNLPSYRLESSKEKKRRGGEEAKAS
jgi:DNA replication protein DnaC